METLTALGHGFAVALTPMNLFWSALGVTVGTAIGVLPGIGPALTVALLLPVTASLDPTAAFIMFGGIYYGLDGFPEEECVVTADPFADCLLLADDFTQYWMGAYGRSAIGATGFPAPEMTTVRPLILREDLLLITGAP